VTRKIPRKQLESIVEESINEAPVGKDLSLINFIRSDDILTEVNPKAKFNINPTLYPQGKTLKNVVTPTNTPVRIIRNQVKRYEPQAKTNPVKVVEVPIVTKKIVKILPEPVKMTPKEVPKLQKGILKASSKVPINTVTSESESESESEAESENESEAESESESEPEFIIGSPKKIPSLRKGSTSQDKINLSLIPVELKTESSKVSNIKRQMILKRDVELDTEKKGQASRGPRKLINTISKSTLSRDTHIKSILEGIDQSKISKRKATKNKYYSNVFLKEKLIELGVKENIPIKEDRIKKINTLLNQYGLYKPELQS
jgi:hypothetical protein